MEPTSSQDTAVAALFALGSSSSSHLWLHLLLADRCNHACEHCYQVQGLKGELTREQIESLLGDFRAGGGFVVTFSGGEATLREDLIPLLTYAHELGLATVLYTNGFTMTEALAGAIAACHVWRVEISLYSHKAEEHDAVTRVPGSWQKTTQGIRWLRAKSVNVVLKFTPTAQSTASAADLAVLARDLDAHLFASELLVAGEGARLEPTVARRAPEQAIAVAGSANEEDEPANPLHGRPCGAGDQLSIRSDGQVQPCSLIHVPMGQIGSDGATLREISASDVAAFFREVTWADFPGCRMCDLRVHCNRCYASAAAEAGDMLAPYPGACELAVARYRKASGRAGAIVADQRAVGEREPALGPYRLDSAGQLLLAKTQRTAYDEALVARYPWLQPSREALQSSACGTAPAKRERGLIQLRRGQIDLPKAPVDRDSP
jgi:radical SAM protein with 4Fe4S-binding SPASM domain